MQKLRLNLEEIRVDRFEMETGADLQGTVIGQGGVATKPIIVCQGTQFVDSCVTGTVRPCPACP